MRALIELEADRTMAYDNAYHNKMRGRFGRALAEEFEEYHGEQKLHYNYSNIFPYSEEIEEGDQRYVLFSCPHRPVVSQVVSWLDREQEFNVGDMSFTVKDTNTLMPDVGGIGSEGVIETSTGVYCAFSKEVADEYDIDSSKVSEGEGTTWVHWKNEHGIKPLERMIQANLQQTLQDVGGEYQHPFDDNLRLFDSYELRKTYSLPFSPTTGKEWTIILSKWRLKYRVRDDKHRECLNTSLDSGIGQKRQYGFGFLNITSKNGDAV